MEKNKFIKLEDSNFNDIIIEDISEKESYGRMSIHVLDSDRIELTQAKASALLPILMEFVYTGKLPDRGA